VITAVTMKNCVFWDVTPCGFCKWLVNANDFPSSLIFPSWLWKRYVPPKSRLSQKPHGVTSQKTAFSSACNLDVREHFWDRVKRHTCLTTPPNTRVETENRSVIRNIFRNIFLFSWDGVSSLPRQPLLGLLYRIRMSDEHTAFRSMRIGRGNRSRGRKPAPVPFCAP
jgi:hypothetical protein